MNTYNDSGKPILYKLQTLYMRVMDRVDNLLLKFHTIVKRVVIIRKMLMSGTAGHASYK